MKKLIFTYAIFFMFYQCSGQCLPLDVTYNAVGYKQFDLGFFSDGRAYAIQTDNKVVVAGPIGLGAGNYDWHISRLQTDGAVDQTFGTNGYVQINFGPTYDEPEDVVIQSDGKIVIVGSSTLVNGVNFCVARLNSDGTLDSAFNNTGKYNLYVNGACYAYKAKIQSDGKILVGGSSTINNERVATLFRLNSDGTIDNSFGIGGIVHMDAVAADNRSEIYDIELNATDIFALGYSNLNFTGTKTVISKMNLNGVLALSFDTDGMLVSNQSTYRKIIVQPSGEFVTMGNGLVVKYLSSGSLDNTFADAGYLGIPYVNIFDAIKGADNNYYYTGTNGAMNDKIIVGRLMPDFNKDTTFCDSSKISLSLGSVHSSYNIMQQTDGKILIGGNADSATVARFVLNGATGVETVTTEFTTLNLFPTIVQDNVIHFNRSIQSADMNLYTISGQLILKTHLTNSKNYYINMRLKGCYFVQLTNKDFNKVFKIWIE